MSGARNFGLGAPALPRRIRRYRRRRLLQCLLPLVFLAAVLLPMAAAFLGSAP